MTLPGPDGAETYDEWHITGVSKTGERYDLLWSKYRGPDRNDPEGAAKALIDTVGRLDGWKEGPTLKRSTVTRTSWAEEPR